jgi:hypothetical protein
LDYLTDFEVQHRLLLRLAHGTHTAIIRMPIASVGAASQIHLGLDAESVKPRPGCRRTEGNTDLTPGLLSWASPITFEPVFNPEAPSARTVLVAGAVGSRFFVREMPRCGIVGSPSIGHLG